MRNQIILLVIFCQFFALSYYAHAFCRCACSVFLTYGIEKHLCPTQPLPGKPCTDWLYNQSVTDAKACRDLGEDTHVCSGYYLEHNKNPKKKWDLQNDGRLHSCRITQKPDAWK